MGEKDIDLEVLRSYFGENKTALLVPYMARVLAEVLLTLHDDPHIVEAECWLKKALETDVRNRTHWGTAQDFVLYADFYKKKGDLPQARESLDKAIDKFSECGADGWVKRTEEKVAQL